MTGQTAFEKFIDWLRRKIMYPYWIVETYIGLRDYAVGDHVEVLVEGHWNAHGVIEDIDHNLFADFPIHVVFDEEYQQEYFTQEYYLPKEIKHI